MRKDSEPRSRACRGQFAIIAVAGFDPATSIEGREASKKMAGTGPVMTILHQRNRSKLENDDEH